MKALFIRAAVFAIFIFVLFSCPTKYAAQAETAVSFTQVIKEPPYPYYTKEECGSSISFYLGNKCCICRDLNKLNLNTSYCSNL